MNSTPPPPSLPTTSVPELSTPTDAAVVVREDFRPDVAAARETVEVTRQLLAVALRDDEG